MLFSRVAIMIAFLFSLVACGGGSSSLVGGGSSGGEMLSGQVIVPNGMVATLDKPSIGGKMLDFVLPTAVANVIGVAPAPAGTVVELVRLNATGSVDSIIASTTTDGSGGYGFNLADLGVSPDITLAVQLTGGFLTAIVTGTNIDITLESQVIFQRIVTEVGASAQLANYTIEEVNALVSGLVRVTRGSGNTVSGLGIDQDLMDVNIELTGNADLNNFVNAAAGPGQEMRGPGDNNYLVNGVIGFDGSISVDGGVAQSYVNQVTTSDAPDVQGVATQQLVANNFLNNGSFSFRLANTLTGIVDYTDVVSGESDEPTPILFFPYLENESTILFDALNIDGEDFRVIYQSFEVQFLTVPAGMFSDVVQVRISTTSTSTTNELIIDFYFAANSGLIRKDISAVVDGSTFDAVEEASSGVVPPLL